ncbi:MAG: M23 family metallopeptidase [Candidatus Sulfomarinibacteraceae bacterium]
MQLGARKPRKKTRLFFVILMVCLIGGGLWLALRVGPTPAVELHTDRPAIGKTTMVSALFSEPVQGLGAIRLELVQGDRVDVLGAQTFTRPAPFFWNRGAGEGEATLDAVVGSRSHDWLVEGEAVLRAVADRSVGFLRRQDAVIVERTLQVRLRPPRLEVLSSQHYGRQGGSGAVVYRVGETAVSSGVRAGDHISEGSPVDGGGPGERFVIYALPWDLDDESAIRLFAEDDAGNRVEMVFLDLFKPRPPRTDDIQLSDGFLERVVPAIASRTAGFDDSGSLLDQYLEINGRLRLAELDRVAALSATSAPEFLWSGPFLQMANSARMAGFAEVRSYYYGGDAVDRQTHLGIDLASTSRAPVPAPNSGRVLFAGWMTLYGNAVIIDHGYGLLTVCSHLSTIEVAGGDVVERGQIIGASGATGLAGGDHLHLEFFVHGQSVDPLEWLDATWIENNITSKIPGAP